MQFKKLFPFYLIILVLVILSRNNIFFWDTYQLGAKQAWALFEQGIFNWKLPSEIDSGHPPIFGMYLASLWKIFSPSLPVSHYAMIPFLLGIIYYVFRIGTHLINEEKAILLLILIMVDACFLGQAILMSPDIILLFFMFQLIYAILLDRPKLKILAATFLGLISMRGMMVMSALILFDVLQAWNLKVALQSLKKYLVYIPAVVTVIFFLMIHYLNTGWVGYHEESEWANAFQFVSIKELIRNVAVYVWRLLDFGRIAVWLGIFFLLARVPNIKADEKLFKLILLTALIDLIISPVLIIYKGLLAHRYLLPLMLMSSFLFWYLLIKSSLTAKRKANLLFLVVVFLLLGNVWVYPKKIAQGWDSTLGHFPYYSLRTKMIDYIDQNNIERSQVGTVFPNIGPIKNFDPKLDEEGFPKYNFEESSYIFYSNVYNDFEDHEIDALEKDWELVKDFSAFTVEVNLYKRKE